MDPLTVIAAIEGVINLANQLGPAAISAGEAAKAIYDHLVSGTTVTQAQLDALEAQLDGTAIDLQAPLPLDDGTTTT